MAGAPRSRPMRCISRRISGRRSRCWPASRSWRSSISRLRTPWPASRSPPSSGRPRSSRDAGDVAEDVLHLVAEDDEDYDHDHSDEDQDERVLDHALTLFAGDQLAEFFEEAMRLHI